MAVAEKRTQVYFPEELYKRLKKRAKQEGKSVASLIREASERYLKEEEEKIDWENDPLLKAIGFCKADVDDLSINHDHYLYGAPKRKIKP
jgi:plasmid stability protein